MFRSGTATTLALLALVLIVFFVAGITEAIGLVFIHHSLVASGALDRHVLAQ